MGNGRSKSSVNKEYVPTDYGENGADLDIDIDIELNERLVSDYENDRYNFMLDEQEVSEFLDGALSKGVNIDFAQDFYDFDSVEEYVDPFYGDVKYLIHDPDLRFSVYQTANILIKLQEKYNDITKDRERLIDRLTFDYYNEDFIFGTTGTHTHDSNSIGTPYFSNRVNLEASEDYLVSFDDIARFRKGTLQEEPSRYKDFLINRNSFRNGWLAVTGTFQNSSLVHEAGHAVYFRLLNRMSVSERDNFIQKAYDWNTRTRYDPVSGYSQSNSKEAFAECFSLYVYGGNSNSQMYKEFKTIIAPAMGIESMYGILK